MYKTQESIFKNSQMLRDREEELQKMDKLWDHSGDETTALLLELTLEKEKKKSAVAQ